MCQTKASSWPGVRGPDEDTTEHPRSTFYGGVVDDHNANTDLSNHGNIFIMALVGTTGRDQQMAILLLLLSSVI